jgi:hypothetical protein
MSQNGKGDGYRKVDGLKYRQNHDDIFKGKTDDGMAHGIVIVDDPLVHPCPQCPYDDTCGMRCTSLAIHEYRLKQRLKVNPHR